MNFCLFVWKTAACLLALLCITAFSSPGTAAQAAPVARWTFDEGTGTTAAAGLPGQGRPAASLRGDAAWTKDARIGAGALDLSGKGSVETPSPLLDTRRSFTVSAWVKLKQTGGYQTVVSQDGSSVSGFFLQLRASGTFGFVMLRSDKPGSAAVASSGSPVRPGVWYQLIGVHDAAAQTLSLYVNGVLQQTVPFTTPWAATGPTVVGRGKYDGNSVDFVSGEIDDVRLDAGVVLDKAAQAATAAGTHALEAALTINLSKNGPLISSLLYGLMIEDISHSIDGGLYAELIQNRAFSDDPRTPTHWTFHSQGSGAGSIALDTTQPVPNTALTHCLRLHITAASNNSPAGVENDGYWGIPVRPSTKYAVSFYAKADAALKIPLTVSLEGEHSLQAWKSLPLLTTRWKKYNLTLTTGPDVMPGDPARGRFVLSAYAPGTVWLTQVSLMPPTYKNRPNGARIDLMQKLAALKPAFLRMPGGNYLEGNTIAERFNWKQTLGDISQRPGHPDPWGYRSTDGFGLLEYLEWAEDLHMKTVLAVFAGYALGGEYVPAGPKLAPYVLDALDEIEYATGSAATKWGARRVRDGHPAPFPVPYVEVGNEDWFDKSGSYDARFAQFYDAIRAKYPKIQIIATESVKSRRPDVVDDHFYRSAGEFVGDTSHYDQYERSGPKIFVGEYASQEGKPTPNLNGALGDAAFMTGMERNADVVVLASYAPLLVNTNPGASQWGTNLIGFDAFRSYVSPAYYTQQLFSLYHGDTVVPATLSGGSGIPYAVSKTRRTGTLYLKLVNPLGSPQTITVSLAGAKMIAPRGKSITLSSAGLGDTNTINESRKVVPKTAALTGIGRRFTKTLPAYSLTVLIITAR